MAEQRIANRQSLKRFARKTVYVQVVDDNGEVELFKLREMSGQEADEFGATVFKEKVVEVDGKTEVKREVDTVGLKAKLVARCWVDEDGQRVYADDEIHQLNAETPSAMITALFKAAEKLNGLEATAQETAAKNSASGQGSDSSTA